MRAYARLRGVSVEAVSKAVRVGRISTVIDGRGKRAIDSEVADREWSANSDHSRWRHQGPKSAPLTEQPVEQQPQVVAPEPTAPVQIQPPAAAEVPVAPAPVSPEGASPASLARSRSVKAVYEAQLKKLEYEEKLGTLISADKVRVDAFQKARTTRDLILNIPNDLSAQLAAETDPKKVHFILTKALTEALESLSRGVSVS